MRISGANEGCEESPERGLGLGLRLRLGLGERGAPVVAQQAGDLVAGEAQREAVDGNHRSEGAAQVLYTPHPCTPSA